MSLSFSSCERENETFQFIFPLRKSLNLRGGKILEICDSKVSVRREFCASWMDFVSRGFVDDLAGNERRAGPDFLLLATSDRESNVGINKNQNIYQN